MTEYARPAVRAQVVEYVGRGLFLEFHATAESGIPPFIHPLRNGANIAAAREILDEGLRRVKEELPTPPTSMSDFSRVSERLLTMGRMLIYGLIGAQPRSVEELGRFWRSAVPTWQLGGVPALVQCLGDKASMLPLELLPVFQMGGAPASSRSEFVAQCDAFVGFSCIVSRTLLPTAPRLGVTLRRNGEGKVPIRYLHHERLVGARSELDWLRSTTATCVDIEGPYPSTEAQEPSLAEQIFDPCLLLKGGRRSMSDQIQHFSCHCYTRLNEPSWKYEMQLRGAGRNVRITIGELGAELVRLAAEQNEHGQPSDHEADKPLVVMNACGTSRLNSISAVSFPALFLEDNNNRGFIGTEIDIPDDVASTFSRFLYTELFLRSCSLGEAVRRARRQLLERFGNPLGLAYSLYADPDTRVEPAPVVLRSLDEREPLR